MQANINWDISSLVYLGLAEVRLTHWHQITRNPVLIKNQQLISIFLFVLSSICTEIVITFPKRPELTKFRFPGT